MSLRRPTASAATERTPTGTHDAHRAGAAARRAAGGRGCRSTLPGVEEQRAAPGEMVDQLEDYVIPRLMTLDAPLLAVVGGSTGAGKSTLVNSLVGTRVTEPGVLRPTTRSPGAGAPPRRRRLVRPGPAAARPRAGRPRHQRPRRAPAGRRRRRCRQGLAILDAPDVDSVEERNRDARGPAAGRRRPVALRHLGGAVRRPGAVGASCARPPSARAAVAIVLDRTPAGGRRHGRRPTSPGCWPAAG